MSTSVSSSFSTTMSNSAAAAVLASAVQSSGTAPGNASTTGTATGAPGTTTGAPDAGTAATEQASNGAAQTQQKVEPFNAPRLILPPDATTREVMVGLTRAMADPTVNKSTAQQLYQLHEQLKSAEQAMIQSIMDGMRS